MLLTWERRSTSGSFIRAKALGGPFGPSCSMQIRLDYCQGSIVPELSTLINYAVSFDAKTKEKVH